MSIIRLITLFISIAQLFKNKRIKKISWRNLLEQVLELIPRLIFYCIISSLLISILLTLQVVKESIRLNIIQDLGGLMWIMAIREVSPMLTGIITIFHLAILISSKIEKRKISDQIDSIYLMQIDLSAFLILPKLIVCCLLLPIINCLSITTIITFSIYITTIVYGLDSNIFVISMLKNFQILDLIKSLLKTVVFGFFLTISSTLSELVLIINMHLISNYIKYFVLTSLVGIFILNVFVTTFIFKEVDFLFYFMI